MVSGLSEGKRLKTGGYVMGCETIYKYNVPVQKASPTAATG